MTTSASDAAWAEAAGVPLVPWVGAGVTSGLRRRDSGRPLAPGWVTFLRDAVSLLDNRAKHDAIGAIEQGRLEEAATVLRRALPVAKWNSLLREQFEVTPAALGPDGLKVLTALWRVSNGLIITTNYDETLRWVQVEGAAPARSYGLHAAPDLSTLMTASPGHPVLWHLHGSIEYPDTIVLERLEYDRLYGTLGHGHTGSSERRDRILDATLLCLRTVVATHNLLFVGTSLLDPRVNDVLADMHRLFPVARTRHFMVCLESEADAVKKRLQDAGMNEYITPLPVRSYQAHLVARLESLANLTGPVAAIPMTEPKWARRRCRVVVAGGAEFTAEVQPLIGESAPQEALMHLRDMLEERELTPFQRTIVQALRYELDAKIDQMVERTSEALEQFELSVAERLNLLLFHAIGLEKKNGQDEIYAAIAALDEVLISDEAPEELRVSAQFNRDVCREKLDQPDVSFAQYVHDKEYRFGTAELLWPKAWNMELVRSARRGVPFLFGDLFEDVIASEVYEASTGVGKTIANWGHYAGRGELDSDLVERLNDIAREATPTQRLPFLLFLASETNDPRFREAIEQALERGGANPTLQRLVQTRRVQGRYTLYGEFLMHGDVWGYVAPTPMHLRGARRGAGVGTWKAESDDIRQLVSRLGLKAQPAIEGDLPFGQGFASSTVLSLLHIGDQLSSAERRRVVDIFDWLSHGFEPSGLDYDAIVAQAPGFYRRGEWRQAAPLMLHGLFLRSSEPPVITLSKTRERIAGVADRLAPLAERLTTGIIYSSELDIEAFAEYCARLSRAGVYTREQMAVFEAAKAAGLMAKAVGGLHGRAMLVIGGSREELESYAVSLDARTLIGRL